MTASLPSLSVQQLTEQLEELLAEYVKTERANQRPGRDPFDFTVAGLKLARRSARDLPTLLATIRRLQAACDAKQAVIDAVTELADTMQAGAEEAEQLTHDPDVGTHGTIRYETEAAMGYDAARLLRTALASPDTAQECSRCGGALRPDQSDETESGLCLTCLNGPLPGRGA